MNDMQFSDKEEAQFEEDEFIMQERERDDRAREKVFGPVEVVTKEECEEIATRYGL